MSEAEATVWAIVWLVAIIFFIVSWTLYGIELLRNRKKAKEPSPLLIEITKLRDEWRKSRDDANRSHSIT